MLYSKMRSLTYLLVICVLAWNVEGKGKGDSYTAEELKVIPKFREFMEKDLTDPIQSEDKYLVRFLRARKLNLVQAQDMLRKNLAWRKENRIDELLSEDFSWWEARFPFYLPNDKEGRPGIVSGLSGMDFRKYVLSGKGPDVRRYIFYCIESSLRNIHRVSNATGTEFISGNLVFNLAGYNSRSHACLSCLPYWIQLAQSYENYYPNLGTRLIAINAPKLFEVILELMSPFMTPATLKALRVYGHNKIEWQEELLKIFPSENLTPEFGGTLKVNKI